MKKEKCPFCNHNAETKQEIKERTLMGKTYYLTRNYYTCPNCGEEWVSPEQMAKNLQQTTEVKRRALGYLSPSDIKALREKHSLTLEQAAELFGTDTKTFADYESGDQLPSDGTDILMQVFKAMPEQTKQIRDSLPYKLQSRKNQHSTII